ncbi:SDR family oxidoreductase [Erwiniaceae bacterium BAC15a-03b]|uniref:SDR family oxidoreductase n=1 Tax=Winslowiella arboricola TaxID=2978220 RepID=A0A9J6PX11_9GAMM|nr:SDR family oxidoreductase [Winslowiella arboricola]MCU5775334.1 SDR family oxidoreductase [Winslowiella arboricola]MCU5780269.1 SDR family oxidoreductase [Winslowiella arboricola]
MTTANNRVAIVTGASRGIGAEIARRLASDGFNVVVNYASSAAEAEAVVEQLKNIGVDALAVKGDIAQAEQVSALFDTAQQAFGRIDVLVNNAGIMKTLPLVEHSDELFTRTFAINVQGTFNTLREAGKRLSAGGRIINLSSTALALNMPGYAIYNGTKAAVEAFTHVFAKELRGREITVNAVAPGPVATDLFLNGKSEEQIQTMANMAPLQRLGEPDDIAAVVAFLASQQSGWINGQVIRANGGLA